MSDYDISGMTDEEKEMPKYTYGSRIPYEWVDDIITKLHQYQEAFESIRTEINEEREHAYADFERYKVEYLGQDWEDALDSLPQDEFRYGMERCLEIISAHDPAKAGKEQE